MDKNIVENIADAFQRNLGNFEFPYIEVLDTSGMPRTFFSKLIDNDYIAADSKTAMSELLKGESTLEFPHSFTVEGGDKSQVNCTAFTVGIDSVRAYVVVQSPKELKEDTRKNIKFFCEIIDKFMEQGSEHCKVLDKYKSQIGSIREMQAKLFPKFQDVPGFDIASAYLPTELMTGNFIDSIYLDNDKFLIIVCDVSRYGSSSIFIGGVIHTMIRYEAQKKMVPSAMIGAVLSKLKKSTPGSHEKLFLSIYLLDLESGKTTISSYGPLYTYFYNKQKNGHVNLLKTETGKLLSNRIFYKDLSLKLDEGDFLMHYSHGLYSAMPEEGEIPFGESDLSKSVFQHRESDSQNIIHSTIDDLYAFTNYSGLDEDVIMVSIRKT